MQVIMLGPLMLKYSLLMMIVAVAAGYWTALTRIRHLETVTRKNVMDDLLTTLLIGILVWKFSTIIFDFKSVIRSPLSLLYYSGGMPGVIFAVVTGFIILAYKCFRYRKAWVLYANTALTWLMSGYAVLSLLRFILKDGGIPAVSCALASACVVVYQFRHKEQLYSTYHLNVTVLWTGLALFASSLLDKAHDPVWLGIGSMQLFLIFVSILSLVLKVIQEKRKPL